MGLFSSLFHSLFDVSTSSESTLPAGKSITVLLMATSVITINFILTHLTAISTTPIMFFLVNSPKPERCVQNVAFVFFPVRMCYPVLWI